VELQTGQIKKDLDINLDIPTKQDIRLAIKKMKKGKVAGIDNILADFLKANNGTATEVIHKLVVQMWKQEKSPQRVE
jgi:hypothetical protein